MHRSRPTPRKRPTRRRSAPQAPMPLFAWAFQHAAPKQPLARLIYLPGAMTPEGEQRVALLIPGRRLPVAFRCMADALDALRRMERGI